MNSKVKIYKSSGPLEKATKVNSRAIAVTGVASAHKPQAGFQKLNWKVEIPPLKTSDRANIFFIAHCSWYLTTHQKTIKKQIGLSS
ncbi:hypothetical protein [Candidatus Vondammii sp. HM_W22]|uniref:hypothetical protein n=1 Tax=Candidatus Vondammii sp. HM_W22 TaxID=2687299 RepID=UPI001F148160|nr:hypothetical protein [Candidatus Vondammii sp. HM_W22]